MQVLTAGIQPVTVDQAYEQLVAAMQDMAQQEARARAAKTFSKIITLRLLLNIADGDCRHATRHSKPSL